MKIKILFFRLLRKLKLIRFLNFSTTISEANKRVKIPILGEIGFGHLYSSEPWMVEILNKLNISHNSMFIDVGVNIGQTLIKFKSHYPNIEYLGFEPNPYCVNYLDVLLQANNWEGVNIIPVGIDQKDGVVILERYTNNRTDSSASMIQEFRNQKSYGRSIIPVLKVESFEQLLEKKKISVIKIDVEGAELEVMKSFMTITTTHRPFFIIEILPVYNKENESRLKRQLEIESILTSLEYKIYRIHKKNNEFHKLEEIKNIGIHQRLDWCDYILAPHSMNY